MEVMIEYLCEKDGNVEREFKSKLNKIFLNSRKKIRAYLVLAKYLQQNTLNVVLCIRTNNNNDQGILKQCADIFSAMFAQGQHLDMMFITDKEEKEIRKLCCPFYTSSDFNIQTPDFYIFSNDYSDLHDTIRNCFKRKRLYGGHTDGYMLCDIDPPIIGQPYGLGCKDITQIIIATRHQGDSLFPISESTIYVFVMRPLIDSIEFKDIIEKPDVELIAWATIYQNKNDMQKYNIG